MRTAVAILQNNSFDRAADVGAADGWYLRALLDNGTIRNGVAIDADPAMNLVGEQNSVGSSVSFHTPDDEAVLQARGTFDLVTCLETLEHVEHQAEILDFVFTLARPGGTILISVPIEVGPMLLVKQLGRWLANRRGGYEYERYHMIELMRAALLWSVPKTRVNLNSHKGFDFRRAQVDIAARGRIKHRTFSPVNALGPFAASTVFWIVEAPATTATDPR